MSNDLVRLMKLAGLKEAKKVEEAKMTIAQAKAELSPLGIVLTKTADDEFRVNFKGGKEETASYETDLEGAIGTGKAMAKHKKDHVKESGEYDYGHLSAERKMHQEPIRDYKFHGRADIDNRYTKAGFGDNPLVEDDGDRFTYTADELGTVKVSDSMTGGSIVLHGQDAQELLGHLEMANGDLAREQELLSHYEHVMEPGVEPDAEEFSHLEDPEGFDNVRDYQDEQALESIQVAIEAITESLKILENRKTDTHLAEVFQTGTLLQRAKTILTKALTETSYEDKLIEKLEKDSEDK